MNLNQFELIESKLLLYHQYQILPPIPRRFYRGKAAKRIQKVEKYNRAAEAPAIRCRTKVDQ